MSELKLHLKIGGFNTCMQSSYGTLKTYRELGASREECDDFAKIIAKECVRRACYIAKEHEGCIAIEDDPISKTFHEDLDFIAERINLLDLSDFERVKVLQKYTTPDKFTWFKLDE